MTLSDALAQAAKRLAPVSDSPRLDAELLMAHALGVEREALLLDTARMAVPAGFAALVARRMQREPIAYILGYRDFWTIRLRVGPGALIPRPDSETLLDAALAHFGASGPSRILDLGTGPGTLLLAALDQWADARGVGLERSEQALAYARANADALGLAARADLRDGDWHDAAQMAALGQFDLVLANPPYVESDADLEPDVRDFEPAAALFAGPDGLDAYRMLMPHIAGLLAPDGIAILEIGWQQAAAVSALAGESGLVATVRQDLAGRDRALLLKAR